MYKLHGEITEEEEEGQVCASSAHAEDGEGGVYAGVYVGDDVDVNYAADEEKKREDEMGDDGEGE